MTTLDHILTWFRTEDPWLRKLLTPLLLTDDHYHHALAVALFYQLQQLPMSEIREANAALLAGQDRHCPAAQYFFDLSPKTLNTIQQAALTNAEMLLQDLHNIPYTQPNPTPPTSRLNLWPSLIQQRTELGALLIWFRRLDHPAAHDLYAILQAIDDRASSLDPPDQTRTNPLLIRTHLFDWN